jgi:hypothetical protein
LIISFQITNLANFGNKRMRGVVWAGLLSLPRDAFHRKSLRPTDQSHGGSCSAVHLSNYCHNLWTGGIALANERDILLISL